MCVRHFLLCFFIVPFFMFAHSQGDHHHKKSIVGTYDVAGFDPTVPEFYTGTAVISEEDGVYTIVWTYPHLNPYIGTGVRQNNEIAFVYNQVNTDFYGTQLYKIFDDTLKGPWIIFQDTLKGYERITKICDDNCFPSSTCE